MQMLYACPNVRTTTHGAKLNLPPMKAVPRAGLRRGHLRARVPARRARGEARPRPARAAARATTPTTSPASGPAVLAARTCVECYRRAEPHWERRHEVRARSTDDGQARRRHGVADLVRRRRPAELRVGARRLRRPRGRRHRDQDVGTGTKTALAQIAAEELGLPLEHVTLVASATRPAGRTRRSRPAPRRCRRWAPPSRAAAADARRQILELAAQRFDATRSSLARGRQVVARGRRAAGRSRRSSGCSATARSSAPARAGRTRPGCRCSRSASRSRRSPSTSRPAR